MDLKLIHLGKGAPTTDYLSMYRLRYQTYCVESQFLDPALYPNDFEYDAYDSISEHFILKFKNTVIGTVRLIHWNSKLPFPTSLHCKELIKELEEHDFPLNDTVEISRLCISKRCRKYPIHILELFKGLYCISKEQNITHWIGSFEETLQRLLHQYGVYFVPLIPYEIEYYGKVHIYGASLERLEKDMIKIRPDLVNFFTN